MSLKRCKYFILTVMLTTFSAELLKAQAIPVQIELNIKNAEEGLKIYLLDLESVNQVIDSGFVKDGRVVYRLTHDGPFLASLNYEFNPNNHLSPGAFNFFADSTPLTISADFKTFTQTRVNCTGINEIMCFSYMMSDSMKALYSGLKQLYYSEHPEELNRLSAEIYKIYERNNLYYIIGNPNSYSSLFMLSGIMFQVNRDTLRAVYNMLSDKNKAGKFGIKIARLLESGEKIKPGDPFRNVSGKNRDGKNISISDFKGKVILLDFWNMHCVPCILQKPYLNSLHKEKYDSGLIVFSYFLDKNHDNFMKSTVNDSWVNVTDDEGFFSKAAIAYGVSGIPLLVLIGRDGKIVGIFQGHEFGEKAYTKLNALISLALKQK